MDFYDLVANRYSIRGFDYDRAIPAEVLQRIFSAGRSAPSAHNNQPWHFIAVRTPEILEKIYSSYARDWIRSASCILVVTGDRDSAWVRNQDNYNSIETDLAIAMDHLILAAAWEGIGSCWIAAFDKNILRQTLGLKENEEVFAFTPLGYAAPDVQTAPKSRKSLDEIVQFL